MSPRGSKQKQTFTKVVRNVSPDDARWLEIERDRAHRFRSEKPGAGLARRA